MITVEEMHVNERKEGYEIRWTSRKRKEKEE